MCIEILLAAREINMHQPHTFDQARIEFLDDVSKKPLYIFIVTALEQIFSDFRYNCLLLVIKHGTALKINMHDYKKRNKKCMSDCRLQRANSSRMTEKDVL